jgi:hypothetical protein
MLFSLILFGWPLKIQNHRNLGIFSTRSRSPPLSLLLAQSVKAAAARTQSIQVSAAALTLSAALLDAAALDAINT